MKSHSFLSQNSKRLRLISNFHELDSWTVLSTIGSPRGLLFFGHLNKNYRDRDRDRDVCNTCTIPFYKTTPATTFTKLQNYPSSYIQINQRIQYNENPINITVTVSVTVTVTVTMTVTVTVTHLMFFCRKASKIMCALIKFISMLCRVYIFVISMVAVSECVYVAYMFQVHFHALPGAHIRV